MFLKWFVLAITLAITIVELLGIYANKPKVRKRFIFIPLLALLTISSFWDTTNEQSEQRIVNDRVDSTLNITKNLVSKLDSMNNIVSSNIDSAKELNDSIVEMKVTLDTLRINFDTQLKKMDETSRVVQVFEEQISNQLKLEQDKFELEGATIEIGSTEMIFELDSVTGESSLKYVGRNIGKRRGYNLVSSPLVLFYDNLDKIYLVAESLDSITSKIQVISSNRQSTARFHSYFKIPIRQTQFPLEFFVVLNLKFEDEFEHEKRDECLFFQYTKLIGREEYGFIGVGNFNEEKLIKYLLENNLENYLSKEILRKYKN